jgi:hypothetical protein
MDPWTTDAEKSARQGGGIHALKETEYGNGSDEKV